MSIKHITYLLLASLALAASLLAVGWTRHGLAQAQSAEAQFAKSEQDLGTLRSQLARWDQMAVMGPVSVEPVDLSATFSPDELPNCAKVLAGLYADRGYFNLRQFSMSWGRAGEGGSAAVSGLSLKIAGEKVFFGRGLTARQGSTR